jgi:leader peptidase (prepilin peptidase)/N-methyltransferase
MSLLVISWFSYLLIFGLLAALAYRDLKDYILPNHLNAALALAFLAFHISTEWQIMTPVEAVYGGLTGGAFLWVIRRLAFKYYGHNDALGLGDVKLAAAGGLGLGYSGILLVLVIGALIGLFHGLYLAQRLKKGDNRLSLSTVNVPAGLGFTIAIALVTLQQFGFEWMK